MAKALGVTVEELLGVTPTKPKRQARPKAGSAIRFFEAGSSKLPRRQQEKVADFVGAFVAQHANGDA